MQNLLVPFLLFIGVLSIIPLALMVYSHSKRWLVLLVFSAIGMIGIVKSPVTYEMDWVDTGSTVELLGDVKSIKLKEAYTEVILEHVTLKTDKDVYNLQSDVLVQCDVETLDYYPNDQVFFKAKVLAPPVQMNPSDMDYGLYLKGKGIAIRLKAIESRVMQQRIGYGYNVKQQIIWQINSIFKGEDKGIVTAVLLGEDELVDEQVDALYFLLGIGHVLALSGLHIGIIAGIMVGVGKWIGLGYYSRHISTLVGVWAYTWFTGAAISTVRACILITVVVVGRCLWEEEDLLTSLALAAGIILMMNPFQLYQVGFQLSFTAVLGIVISQYLISNIQEHFKIKKPILKFIQMAMPCVCIAVVINPVLAYHFFEAPLIGVLFNVIIIPLFSVLVPCMLICVGISYLSIGLAQVLAYGIVTVLNSIQAVGEVLALLPAATLCMGRPSFVEIILYYVGVLSFVIMIDYTRHLQKGCILISCVLGVNLLMIVGVEKSLEITQLYVGQGDATVVITPNQNAILIDGGPKGKGKTIERFLKYKGIREVDLAFVSHPHEDHTRGIIELLEQGISVGGVLIPEGFVIEGELEKLYQVCEKKNVPIYQIQVGNTISIDQVLIRCVWPSKDEGILDANEGSAVLLMEYKTFKALYTGDIGKATEKLLSDQLEDVDLLKVAHHGSKNSTDDRFLLQTTPEYAMISCGINNWYNHPHSETLERLGEYPIEVLRTDQQGAVTLVTNGYNNIKIDMHIQEDKK